MSKIAWRSLTNPQATDVLVIYFYFYFYVFLNAGATQADFFCCWSKVLLLVCSVVPENGKAFAQITAGLNPFKEVSVARSSTITTYFADLPVVTGNTNVTHH